MPPDFSPWRYARGDPAHQLRAVGVGVADDAADVVSLEHVAVAVVDLLERVIPGHHVIEIEMPQLVEFENFGDIALRVAATEQAALQVLLRSEEHTSEL